MGLPEATYLAWLDFNDADLPDDPQRFFLQRARVAMNECDPFGPGSCGFGRLNFGCPRSILTEALERMERALTTKNQSTQGPPSL
jgi:cystathionine beta-lyase